MAKRKKVKLNVPKSVRMDPTRTFTIRKAMAGQFRKRWNSVKGIVNKTIIENDGLGIKTQKPNLTFNQVAGLPNIKSLTNAQRMRAFSDWFGIMAADQLENPKGWFDKFIAQAYEKGLAQSFQEAKRTGILPEQFASMKTDDFIFQATRTQIHRDAVSLAFERTSKAVKGVYNAVTDEGARIISDGLANGDNPRVIASKLNKRIDKIGITRARAIAQTETIRAHADATLNNYESFGEDEIVVLAEWSNAGDDRVCSRCLSMDGAVFTIKEARGLIPFHVWCRCSWIPFVPSEEKKTKAMAKATQKKVRESIARDGGSKRSAWAGTEKQSIAGKTPIASKKPRQSTLDKELNAIRKDRGDEPLPAGSASKG